MIRNVRGGVALFVVWGVWLGVASAPGCRGVTAEDACNTVCDCTGCDEDDCVEELEDAEDEAKDEKCEDDYAAYLECIHNKLDCDDDRADFGDCKDEVDDLADCIEKKNMPFASPCADLKRECKDCGESRELCEATVDLVEEIGGEEACEDVIDQGGVNCDGEGGGGGGTPTGCDDGTVSAIDSAACDSCVSCAFEGTCASDVATFQSMSGAQAYLNCVGSCTTDACFSGCSSAYPAEESAYFTALSCAVCYECPYNCDAATNCE